MVRHSWSRKATDCTHTPLNMHPNAPIPHSKLPHTMQGTFSNHVYPWEINMCVYVDTQPSLTRLLARYAWHK